MALAVVADAVGESGPCAVAVIGGPAMDRIDNNQRASQQASRSPQIISIPYAPRISLVTTIIMSTPTYVSLRPLLIYLGLVLFQIFLQNKNSTIFVCI
jgi:hypothetical protein